jgi:hypothetical protein
MNGISTDVIALAAILGSAAVGGVATLALTDGGSNDFSFECATTVVETAPRVVVSLGGADGAIVVAPDVRVHTEEACSNVVRLNVHEMDRARQRVGRVRIEGLQGEVELQEIDLDGLMIELEGLEGVMEMGGLGEILEMELDGLDEMLEMAIEGRLEKEMLELEKQLERLERGNGR